MKQKKQELKQRKKKLRDLKQIKYKNQPKGCGDCHECCSVFPLGDKPAGVLCQHCGDKGCKKYAERPQVCKDFECIWLQQQKYNAANPELRPDKSGLIVSFKGVIDGVRVMAVNETRPGAWKSKIGSNLNTILRNGKNLIMVFSYEGLGVCYKHLDIHQQKAEEITNKCLEQCTEISEQHKSLDGF